MLNLSANEDEKRSTSVIIDATGVHEDKYSPKLGNLLILSYLN